MGTAGRFGGACRSSSGMLCRGPRVPIPALLFEPHAFVFLALSRDFPILEKGVMFYFYGMGVGSFDAF